MFYRKLLQTHKIYRKFKTYPNIGSDYWKDKLAQYEVSPQKVEYDPTTGKLFYKPLGIYLTPNKHDFLLSQTSVYKINGLKNLSGCEFTIDHDEKLIIKIDNTELYIENPQELEIAHEIFFMEIYNFVYDKPVVVVDVGMNTGFASLYFAKRDNVIGVYSYEPFQATYAQALRNFSLNPSLESKINPFNYGVGGKEEILSVEYDYSVKGSIGIEGIAGQYKNSVSKNIVKENLTIKPFSEVFTDILVQHPGVEIVAKIDCEGSEYEIIKCLAANNLLHQIKIILMEWHYRGPDTLVEQLQKVGFVCFSRLPHSKNVGSIYAVRC
ncbi:MAG: hypothetical protein N5P05_002441 [Chroococcopsis gigantea SAG 12.99]|jgi:FkbM family methyltransferase|nr:hypothetical protein [Chroococcopsis gigantea SAG 12.99]